MTDFECSFKAYRWMPFDDKKLWMDRSAFLRHWHIQLCMFSDWEVGDDE